MAMSETTISKTELEQLVAEADVGGRKPSGLPAKTIMAVAVAWSLFQLWYASPLPFMLGFGIFSDGSARPSIIITNVLVNGSPGSTTGPYCVPFMSVS